MAKTQDENLITHVLGDDAIARKIGKRMHFNRIGQDEAFPRILFTRAGTSLDGCLGDEAGTDPNRETFLLEIQAASDRDAEDIRKLVEDRLNCYRGTFGDTTVQGIFAESWSSRHEPRVPGSEAGIYFASAPVEVVLS